MQYRTVGYRTIHYQDIIYSGPGQIEQKPKNNNHRERNTHPCYPLRTAVPGIVEPVVRAGGGGALRVVQS